MKKNTSTTHVQIEGEACFDSNNKDKFISFEPLDPIEGTLKGYRRRAVVQAMSNGRFEVEMKPYQKTRSKLLMKLEHGRLSQTCQDDIRLTLSFGMTERNMVAMMKSEVNRAIVRLIKLQEDL